MVFRLLGCTLHCVHFIALSHEAKSEWYRTQLAKFCGGRGICTDVTSGAEKFTLGSRIRLRGTGYSWPGLFSGSLQVHSRFNMFTWMIKLLYINQVLSRIHQQNTYFYDYVCSARFGVVCNSAPFFNNVSCAI